jgi:cullin-4
VDLAHHHRHAGLCWCALQKRLEQEFERCQVYLDVISRKPLVRCVEKQLVEHHVLAILVRGFNQMVAQHRVADLARLYTLCARVKALEALRTAFKECIKTSGEALVMDQEKVPPPPQTP